MYDGYFVFNRNKDERINKIIADENIPVGNMVYETYLGADILFELQDDGKWGFKLYSRIRQTSLETMLVISALISIKHRESPWYELSSKPFLLGVKEFLLELNIKDPEEQKLMDNILFDIEDGIRYAFEARYALKKEYLTQEEVFYLLEYFQNGSFSHDMGFKFLGTMAALRTADKDVSKFHSLLISLKKYDLLQVIDLMEDCLVKNIIDFKIIKAIFNLVYPTIDKMKKDMTEIQDQLKIDSDVKYHMVLSFAGEDRKIVEKIAASLVSSGYSIFYDRYETADLWGKDLYEHLHEVYSNRSKFCLMIISEHYAKKKWTTHERKAAQARAFRENQEYILPLRLDNTEIPGLSETVGYVDYYQTDFEDLISIIKQKLNK